MPTTTIITEGDIHIFVSHNIKLWTSTDMLSGNTHILCAPSTYAGKVFIFKRLVGNEFEVAKLFHINPPAAIEFEIPEDKDYLVEHVSFSVLGTLRNESRGLVEDIKPSRGNTLQHVVTR